jgi:tyrosyl-tRNA synthetase
LTKYSVYFNKQNKQEAKNETTGLLNGATQSLINENFTTKKQLRIKLGIDPTSNTLHLGHFVLLRKLRKFQEQGHIAVLVIGDFTASIGDPTGKNQSRKSLTQEEIKANTTALLEQIKPLLLPDNLEIHFNSEWLGKMNTTELFNLLAQLSANQLLNKKDFSDRLTNGNRLGLNEMLYPVLQGLDSVHLRSDVELGGNDQLFNINMGRTLQELNGQPKQSLILMPILPALKGKEKMSKSLNNGILLNLNQQEMFSRLHQVSDENLDLFLTLLTDIDPQLMTDPHQKQKALATAVIEQLFPNQELPTLTINEPMLLSQILKLSGFCPSTSQARKAITNNGISLNGEKQLTDKLLSEGGLIKFGKHKQLLLKLTS